MPSSVVAAIKYDARAARLRITFVSGKVYDYKNVPEDVYNAMRVASSKGMFLNTEIKGKYTYQKVR